MPGRRAASAHVDDHRARRAWRTGHHRWPMMAPGPVLGDQESGRFLAFATLRRAVAPRLLRVLGKTSGLRGAVPSATAAVIGSVSPSPAEGTGIGTAHGRVDLALARLSAGGAGDLTAVARRDRSGMDSILPPRWPRNDSRSRRANQIACPMMTGAASSASVAVPRRGLARGSLAGVPTGSGGSADEDPNPANGTRGHDLNNVVVGRYAIVPRRYVRQTTARSKTVGSAPTTSDNPYYRWDDPFATIAVYSAARW